MIRWLMALLLLAALIPGRAAATDESPLSIGVAVEREFAGEQEHAYRLALAAGEFVQLSIQQTGVEVVAALAGPDGAKLAEFAESVGDHGVREIHFIARTAGTHRLAVRRYRNTAPPTRYTIRLEAQRSATDDDERRLRAVAVAAEARRFLWSPRPISAEEAARIEAKFREAIRLGESLGDSRLIAECLLDLGILRSRTGDPLGARELFEQALPLFPETPAAIAPKASTLNNLGDNYLRFGETEKALDLFRQSLALKKPGRSRAISLDNLGSLYSRIGEYQLALAHHQEALALFRERNLIRDEAVALNNLANAWGRLGDLPRSLDYIRQALARIRETGDKEEEASYLYNEGSFHFELGQHAEALAAAQQSLTLSRAIRSAANEADALTLVCKIRLAMGESAAALGECERALTMHRANRDRLSEAMTLATIGQLHQKTGDRGRAIEAREASLALYRAAGDPFNTASNLHALGQLALEEGDLAAAQGRLDEAVAISESQRVKAGSHLLRATAWVGAQRIYESSVELLLRRHEREPARGHDRRAMELLERARARSLLDLLAEARAQIRRGADPALLAEERQLLQRLNAKDAAWKRFRGSARFAAQAEALALEVSDLTTRLQLLEGRIRASSPQYAALTQPTPVAIEEIQQRVLDPGTVLLEFSLGREAGRLWAVTPDAVATFPLAPEREIRAAARRLYDLLTARQPRPDLSEAEQIARIREADAGWDHAARRLSDLLLGPIAGRLRGEWRGKRLAIVAPGPLEYLPFAALPMPGEGAAPLLAGHEIVHLPSASALDLLRREPRERVEPQKTLAILADPVFESNDPRLAAARKRADRPGLIAGPGAPMPPDLAQSARSLSREGFGRLLFSREEADAIERLAPPASTLKATGFDASRQLAAGGSLRGYRILHFATHGVINTEHPALSGLVLSLLDRNGATQDGFLRMHEIYNLDLPADLVFLSACQTALGREIRGEGLVGLTRGFMYAGARRVLASLWQVDDYATAQLMQRFYRGLFREHLSPAAALRAAQLEMMKQKRWAAPYFWAGFVLQGEWR